MSDQEQNGRLQPHHHRLELSPAPQSTDCYSQPWLCEKTSAGNGGHQVDTGRQRNRSHFC